MAIYCSDTDHLAFFLMSWKETQSWHKYFLHQNVADRKRNWFNWGDGGIIFLPLECRYPDFYETMGYRCRTAVPMRTRRWARLPLYLAILLRHLERPRGAKHGFSISSGLLAIELERTLFVAVSLFQILVHMRIALFNRLELGNRAML